MMVIRNKNAVLVVLGDIGRSPRMCYHAKSLAEKNYRVQIVGYVDTLPFPAISKNPNIRLVGLRHPPDRISSLPSALMLVLKCIWTFGVLLFALLFRVNWPLLILMQNPPGVPCMLACWMVARVKHAQFIIDWHNYTYSILRETYGVEDLRLERYTDRISGRIDDQSGTINSSNISDVRNRRMTKTERAALATVSATCKKKRVVERRKRITLIQRFIEFAYSWEGFFGRRSDLNICVTHSMRRDLSDSWGIKSATLYDRPPASIFHKLSVEETHTVFWELANQSEEFKVFAENDPKVLDAMDGDFTEVTKFSYRDGDGIAFLRDDRPLILMSSTSWTEDEDFGLLLNALQSFDKVAGLSGKSNPQTRLPHLICIITGRGPLKTYYMGRIEHLQMQNVQVITPWVDAEDYPRLLGSADIGVSLHTSTSGLDLPMKVVDMFGSGLPVLAKKFTCIGELVIDGQNGRLFDTSHELCDLIKSLTCGFPLHSSQLHALAVNLATDPPITWEKNWDACVWPLISAYGCAPLEEVARRHRFAVTEEAEVVDSYDDSPSCTADEFQDESEVSDSSRLTPLPPTSTVNLTPNMANPYSFSGELGSSPPDISSDHPDEFDGEILDGNSAPMLGTNDGNCDHLDFSTIKADCHEKD